MQTNYIYLFMNFFFTIDRYFKNLVNRLILYVITFNNFVFPVSMSDTILSSKFFLHKRIVLIVHYFCNPLGSVNWNRKKWQGQKHYEICTLLFYLRFILRTGTFDDDTEPGKDTSYTYNSLCIWINCKEIVIIIEQTVHLFSKVGVCLSFSPFIQQMSNSIWFVAY